MSQSQTVPEQLIEKIIELTNIVQKMNESIGYHDDLINHCQQGIEKLFDRIEPFEKLNSYCPLCTGKNDDSIL